jgi:hypothetical protein
MIASTRTRAAIPALNSLFFIKLPPKKRMVKHVDSGFHQKIAGRASVYSTAAPYGETDKAKT